MFATTEFARAQIFELDPDGVEQLWWFVENRTNQYWFHVSYRNKLDEHKIENTIHISHLNHLLEFQGTENIEILEVELVTPGHINGSGRWQMDMLVKVEKAVDPIDDQQLLAFTLQNNVVYTYPKTNSDPNRLEKRTTIYCKNEVQTP